MRSSLVLALSIVGAASLGLAQSEPSPISFYQPKETLLGTEVYQLVSPDLNGDSFTDLVGVSYTSVLVLYSDGHGGYTQPLILSVPGGAPKQCTVGDFNADGVPDIAVVAPGFVYLYLGEGGNTFSAPIQVATTGNRSAFQSIVAADFNSDGRLDLAVVSSPYAAFVTIFIGDGKGGFVPGPSIELRQAVEQLWLGDFDGNGAPDLLTLQYCLGGQPCYSRFEVLLGIGDGTLRTTHDFSPPTTVIALGDVNGDGKTDIVMDSNRNTFGAPQPYGLTSLLSNGDGTFTEAPRSLTVEAAGPLSLYDLNGDGLLDVITVVNNGLNIAYGNGDGTFVPGPYSYGCPYGGPVTLVRSGPDSLEFAQLGSGVNVVGGGILVCSTPLARGLPVAEKPIFAGFRANYPVTADFNGDKKADFVVSSPNAEILYAGNGDGTFQLPKQIASVADYNPALVTDINRDGKPDIFLESASTLYVPYMLLLGHGDGTFETKTLANVLSNGYPIQVADINGDGIPDIVQSAGNCDCYGPVVYLGNGDGTFRDGIINPYPSISVGAIGDFNGDGKLDLVAPPTSLNGTALFLEGNGDGTFQPPQSLGFPLWTIATADLNGDGMLDLVAYNIDASVRDNYFVVVGMGGGDGTFRRTQAYLAPELAGGVVTLRDLNGDGILDIAVDAPDYSVFLAGRGDGTFVQPKQLFLLGPGTNEGPVAFGDFRGDGKPDSISADGRGEIWIVRNTSR